MALDPLHACHQIDRDLVPKAWAAVNATADIASSVSGGLAGVATTLSGAPPAIDALVAVVIDVVQPAATAADLQVGCALGSQ
jgi:hypothetical protein